MPEYWWAWLAVVGGIAGLVWSADRFVAGSAALAGNLGVPKLIIGLTLVSLGTSAPEILVSINATIDDAGELAVGNALGSNLANMGLVLAVTALISAIPIRRAVLVQEVPALLLVTALAGLFLYDSYLSVWEGVSLLLLIPALLYLMVRLKRQQLAATGPEEIPDLKTSTATFWFVVGLAALILSARVLVWGAQAVALELGVSPLVIGLTVIAVGTSLPELAASAASALKGHHDIALGNVIGSNIFNLLAVMPIPALAGGLSLDASVFSRDYMAMGLMTFALCFALFVDYRFRRSEYQDGRAGRVVGFALLLGYIAYYGVLFAP